MNNLFSKYQEPLKKLTNHPLGRKFLGISHEVKDKIVGLTDNAYAVRVGRNKYQATFRCYNLFEKKLGSALKFSDSLLEGIKYYFTPQEFRWLEYCDSPETIYSGAGDGNIEANAKGSWSLARDATTGDEVNDDGAAVYVSTRNVAGSYYVQRLFFPFDLTTLPSGITVTSATLRITATDDAVGSAYNLVVVPTSQASTSELVVEDFNNLTFTAESDLVARPATASSSATFTFNAAGKTLIASAASGWLKIGVITENDLNNSAVGLDNNYVTIVMSEDGSTSTDPKLIVTYTLPSGGGGPMFFSGGLTLG